MYQPKHFEELDVAVMHRLLREQPLATLVTVGPNGPDANMIPLHLTVAPESPLGLLRGHVARANPLWQEHAAEFPVLAVFHGGESYISPSWYATKPQTGRVVPTWNYAVVQARGRMRVIDDPVWLRAQLEALTQAQEARFAHPWSVENAPSDYIDGLLRTIIGIEIAVQTLQGKWKVSQNQTEPNRQGVIQGLEALRTEAAMHMADHMRERM